jgi:hypothetical protein
MKKKNDFLSLISPCPENQGKAQNIQPFVSVEGGEKLIENALCDILHLRAHSYGLGVNVH